MSHEGIRIIPADEARREDSSLLGGDAIRPARVRVDKTGGTGMDIAWRDGHTSRWTFAWLRAACPCATCKEERDKAGRSIGNAESRPAALLPMYKAPPRPIEVSPVGNYAIRFKWNDGHEAGLYSWEYLRNACDAAIPKDSVYVADDLMPILREDSSVSAKGD